MDLTGGSHRQLQGVGLREAPSPNAERCRWDRLSQTDGEGQPRPVRAGGIENFRQLKPQGTRSQASQVWMGTVSSLASRCVPLPLDGRIAWVVRSRGRLIVLRGTCLRTKYRKQEAP